ncbi:MAG TPA: mannonate dehydratase [Trueperaceae bacterium]|nr:mannonate dehydratase [Trueperaceae bacterium]
MSATRDGGAVQFTFRWWGPHDLVPLAHLAQVPNVRTVVTALENVPVGEAWTSAAIRDRQELCRAAGLEWTVVESVGVHEAIKLASPDRDRYVEAYATTITRLGEAGVGTVCYNFMPVFDWMRTDFDYRLPDGSSVVSYSQAQLDAIDLSKGLPRLPAWPQAYSAADLESLFDRYAGVTDEEFLARYRYFIEAIAPVAEAAGVRLAIHPDDPPWPIFGLPRIVGDAAAIQAVLDCSSSPAHGLTFCTGSLGASAKNDLPAMARSFARRTHFVHARNVKRRGEREFHEVDHTPEAGDVDLVAVMAALVAGGFSGPLRPDHGRMIWGETGIPGYGLYDRALGLMYLQGVYGALTRAGGTR